ncbi:MAG: bifunctional diaminohydroxyphosphoribosylaminopyrimidine deaminase/5-amino-6-(5-phosphoribosylamino)uracil reductase RibD [Chloroflexi bacterium]|nr:bifunctional diaminohydroxyphosphoribosylaminopyrimidine deaminase/5-amino-6-(5-phosphoribosylamino)uracil reductase RibD [Chloroflexota bacterium]
MGRALRLAERALGWCSPNPAVGAVLTRGDQVVGEGFTQPPGASHAEIMALNEAGEAARGAKLYVTLEPCSHHGRTPPCTDALISAGIREVYVAQLDPSPWVDGSGIAALEAAQIAVHVGDREADAGTLNEAYFKWVASGLPFVILKYAMTADGKIATRSGSSHWITHPEARGYVARLRSQVDAVMTGIGTVIRDDPLLTARPAEFGIDSDEPVHQPLRVVLDSEARLPSTARVADPRLPGHTVVCTTSRAAPSEVARLEDQGVEVLILPARDERVDIHAVLVALGGRGVTSVLVESGGTLAASLIKARAVDKVLGFIAPRIVGGMEAPGPIGGLGLDDMDAALDLRNAEWTQVGPDMLLTGYLQTEGSGSRLEGAVVFGDH